jgi:HupE/UreJ protein
MPVRSGPVFSRVRRSIACAALAIACVLGLRAIAHEIPADIKINAFLKPAGDKLNLVIRVPLSAMQGIELPTRGPGYLDVSRADEALRNATKLWLIDNIEVYENGSPLPAPTIAQARVSLPSDKSFASYEEALAHLQGPRLADSLDLYWNQQLLDVLLEYPIRSDRAEFAIHPHVDRLALKVTTALRFLPPDGAVRAFEFHGDPGLFRLDPRWHHAALRFVASGFWHILSGLDHLLFLACLVLPFRRLRPLIVIVTAFTVAHSISLIAAAFGFVPDALWFPPLVETLIAVTIVYMALENIVAAALNKSGESGLSRRWIMAFAFGLIHGFGFSFGLRESFQFAGDHLVTALLGFNLGVEIGQIAVLLVLIPALGLLFRYVLPERIGIIILSALVAHTAWHWMLERGADLAKFPFPTIDAAFLAGAMRALMALLILAGLVWLASGLLGRWLEPKDMTATKDVAGKPSR